MSDDIKSVLVENRVFPPSSTFSTHARVKSMAEYEELYQKADRDPDGFWGGIAKELTWSKPWTKVLEWKLPDAKWFVGAETNLAVNCLDRFKGTPTWQKRAIIWEGEPGELKNLTYAELCELVQKFANVLTELGVKPGDRVAIYMPMIPEVVVAMLGCARVGAMHSVVFGGFSADALRDRIRDAGAKLVITADGGWRRGQVVPLKDNVDAAVKDTEVKRVIVVKRTKNKVVWDQGKDLDWDDLMKNARAEHTAPALPAEHPLFSLYTSGTTGKPKGILHTTGGYMVGVYYTTRMVFDLKDDDIFWCTADVGWVTGHSYTVYGALLNGATTVIYEGAPNQPENDRFWDIIERHKVTIFYTAPTAIRTFSRWGEEWPKKHNLSSLRLLGSVGEPINPEAWMWYHKNIGQERCPIVDTWWQTETGAIMIAPLPGAIPTKPGSCTKPLPGIAADIVNKQGKSAGPNEGGFLVIKKPWPSMLRTIWGDHERFQKTYFSEIEGVYFAGDGARKDDDGYFWVMGRIDDVLNVSGHRLSTMEVESALVSHDKVAEAAVVGRADAMKGQAIVAFVTPMKGINGSKALGDELRAFVAKQIGALARPEEIRFADALPKTRSGKIMRRLLRDVAAGQGATGDTTTLEDAGVLQRLAAERGDEE
jgi:acetyl-CoA synthetase